jgi:hypothetical protein
MSSLEKRISRHKQYLIEASSQYKHWKAEVIKNVGLLRASIDLEKDSENRSKLIEKLKEEYNKEFPLEEIKVDAPNAEYIYKQIQKLERRLAK